MTADYFQRRNFATQHLRGTVCAIFMIDSVKPIAPDSALEPLIRPRINDSIVRHGAMKSGIEDRDLGFARKQLLGNFNPLQSCLVVQRCNGRNVGNGLLNFWRDNCRLVKMWPTVNNSVAGYGDFGAVADSLCRGLPQLLQHLLK